MGKKRRPDPDDLPDDNFEVVEDDPPPRKKRKPQVVEEDEDEEPRRVRRPVRAIAADEDEDDEPIPVPKRKKKKKKRVEEPEEEAPNEWAVPLVLMGIGLVLTIIGTIGYARTPDFGLSAGAAVAFRLIGQVIVIPITIVALIGIGTVMGIEYGTLTSTIRNLAAMGLFIGGLVDVMDWAHLPWFIAQPIIFVVGLGLLMSLFGLDVDEAMFTMMGLNLLSFLLKMALFMVIMMMVHKAVNKPGGFGPGGPNTPGWVDPDGIDPDDDDPDDPDAMPRPKAKGKNGKNPKGKNRPQVPPPFNPDD